MPQTNLSAYNNSAYSPGGNALKRVLWYYINAVFFKSYWLPVNGVKIFLLRLFGAQIGKGVVIKPGVNIKYAWNLQIGNNTWIGERVWIDNLVKVVIGGNACISQGAMLQTGSHNYKKAAFDLITGQIILEDGVWIGCGAIINQGITAASHAVLASGSVASKNLKPFTIYQGNPAVAVRARVIE
ncbi:WcaF family extracellular polysaccharide biosynthesis acetyltransferase [Mucilaginibacter phyllosphaerae]|uniref:Colanic acid biosynthesis acetyltransferase WcaF n=1 Tax=Mucilaginibacter phyllosphaerae TaxID=1812349 RepID=A0A4Y8AI22_9SPHI|nr:WcaF family extracellular polysaccharide biosynthesis acetyltransferase [Mucilaginibacter phyllosphaerae]MBB3968569.1 putative colanic acid biosynthesis acetyltransferase WcaF [Mucilaginibacter phyllosphaerae]TEW67791.1 colanic acid biosynthesis acetyltransferase WcaF [Mucilaginibacter phyllosphaerae]GGH15180.1 colanic acid biosynthesis acetyltransferase WcaF [Mucilaginibacter phyllosphaerae]